MSVALTMHQPWASLLVYGIKMCEGRVWSTEHRGRLWIHAASKPVDMDAVRALGVEYREVNAINNVLMSFCCLCVFFLA